MVFDEGVVQNHTATIYDRGGVVPLGELTRLRDVRWNRVRDDISQASVRLTSSPDCASLLGELATNRHELVLHRKGVRVWEGPITHLQYRGSDIQIGARDLLHYANRTAIKEPLSNSYPRMVSVVERALTLLRREMAMHEEPHFDSVPSLNFLPGVQAFFDDDDAQNSSTTLPYEKYVWEELDDLAHTGGLDYTMVGRNTYLYDTHTNIGEGRRLTDEDFESDVIVTIYGMELATISTVSDRRGRWASVGQDDPFYGAIELLHGTYNEDDDPDDPDFQEVSIEEMREQALRNMVGRFPLPLVVRVPQNASIRAETFEELQAYLIPGVRFPLRSTSTVKSVEQIQKLDNVSVQETSTGERISISLSPAPSVQPMEVK